MPSHICTLNHNFKGIIQVELCHHVPGSSHVCVFVCVVVAGPAKARWTSDSAGRASRREPDAGAV